MRAFMQRQVGIFALLLVAAFALPALAHADSDQTLTIGGAVVRVLVVNGKTFIAVKFGTLKLKYADGTDMADIPAGTALMLEGFTGNPSSIDGALQLGARSGASFSLALSAGSPNLSYHFPDGSRSTVGSGTAINVITNEIAYRSNGRVVHFLSSTGRWTRFSDIDRKELSAIGH